MTTDNAQGPKAGPSGIALPETAFSRGVHRLIAGFGEIGSALWTVLVAVIVVQVVARYAFGRGSIMMEELQWHLYAIGFMLGLSFTEISERHVRIDVFAERWSPRVRLWIEAVGLAGLMLTFCAVVLWFAVPFAATAFKLGEVSAAPGGLPYRWFLKSFIVTAFALLALAGLARLQRVVIALSRPAA